MIATLFRAFARGFRAERERLSQATRPAPLSVLAEIESRLDTSPMFYEPPTESELRAIRAILDEEVVYLRPDRRLTD